MSRSNPTANEPHPCTRWFEWNGEEGNIRWYDKQTKQQVYLEPDFTFLLLDQLACVKGWHDASDSGIYSNEVRDTAQDVMIVKAFKGGVLAKGTYQSIKDRVNAIGGRFTANCYIAFKTDAGFALGSIQFKKASLNAWVEFCKTCRGELYKSAVRITGYKEGKKGKVVFRVPTFELKPTSKETDSAAMEIDKVLQAYLSRYLSRTRVEQAESTPKPEAPEPEQEAPQDEPQPDAGYDAPDDVPF